MVPISLNSWKQSYKSIVNIHYLKKRFNPRFFLGLVKKLYIESKNKNTPWLTPEANNLLKQWIRSSDFILKFGSGASTIWFSKFAKKIIIIEHDKKWYTITKNLTNKKHSNVELFFAPTKNEYLRTIKYIPDNPVDVCLIDGQWRYDCLLGSFSKVKSGGLVVLDNAETLLPLSWDSYSFQVSWKFRGSPEKNKVKQILNKIKKNWRLVATSDVSQDTLLFIKYA